MMEDLPKILERMEDTAKKVYDPHQIWLESMQFADYVSQLGTHLLDCGEPNCTEGLAEQLINMSDSFKQMGESALQVLDEAEREFDESQQ